MKLSQSRSTQHALDLQPHLGCGIEEVQLFSGQLQGHRFTHAQAPIRFDAGTARHRNALAGTAAEGIAEGEFVIAKVDFDGDGTDETVVQGRARLWCSEAGCSTMVLKKAGAQSVVLLDANLPKTLGVTRAPVGRYRALVGLDGSGRIAIGDRKDGRMYGRPLVFPLRTER